MKRNWNCINSYSVYWIPEFRQIRITLLKTVVVWIGKSRLIGIRRTCKAFPCPSCIRLSTSRIRLEYALVHPDSSWETGQIQSSLSRYLMPLVLSLLISLPRYNLRGIPWAYTVTYTVTWYCISKQLNECTFKRTKQLMTHDGFTWK